MKSQNSGRSASQAHPIALTTSTLQSVSLQNVLIAGWVLTIATVAIALGQGA